jgi:hypothetical protein
MRYLKNFLMLCFVLATGSILGLAQDSRCPLPLSRTAGAHAATVSPELAKQVLGRAFSWMETPANEQKEILQKAENSQEGISVLFCAEAIQLNRTGKPELFIHAAAAGFPSYCQAQNCPVWVYRSTASGYQLLLEDSMVDEFAPQYRNVVRLRTSTNGYRDMRIVQYDSAWKTDIRILKFDGRRYRARVCITETCLKKGKRCKHTRHKCESYPDRTSRSEPQTPLRIAQEQPWRVRR